MPSTYTEFTFNPSTAGSVCVMNAPAIMTGQIALRRVAIHSNSIVRQRVRLTRHGALGSGGTTNTVHQTEDSATAAKTTVRVTSGGTPVTFPGSPGATITRQFDTLDFLLEPTIGDGFSIGAGKSFVLALLEDHDATYTIGLEFEEPTL